MSLATSNITITFSSMNFGRGRMTDSMSTSSYAFLVLAFEVECVICGVSMVLHPDLFVSSTTPSYYYDGLTHFDILPSEFVNSLQNNKSWDVISSYCPDVKECYSNLNKLSGNLSGCCLKCDCSEDCFAKGNCCHDKEKERFQREDSGKYTSDGMTCVSVYLENPWEPPDVFFLHNVMLQQ